MNMEGDTYQHEPYTRAKPPSRVASCVMILGDLSMYRKQ